MRTRNNDDDDINPFEMRKPEPLPYGSYVLPNISRIQHFYISDGVGEPSKYVDMVHKLLTATENDIFYFHLNTPGGRLDTGVQLINAIRSSLGTIVMALESQAHSLGTLLFLSGDQFIVHDNCMMMFHNYSSGTFGKGNEQVAEVQAMQKWFNGLMKQICYPFLSHEEIDKIQKGEDLWLESAAIRKRLEKAIKQHQEESQKPKKKVKKIVEEAATPVEVPVEAIVEEAAPVKKSRRQTVGPKP